MGHPYTVTGISQSIAQKPESLTAIISLSTRYSPILTLRLALGFFAQASLLTYALRPQNLPFSSVDRSLPETLYVPSHDRQIFHASVQSSFNLPITQSRIDSNKHIRLQFILFPQLPRTYLPIFTYLDPHQTKHSSPLHYFHPLEPLRTSITSRVY